MRTASSSLTRCGQALPSFPGAESVLLHLAGHICQRHRGMQELPQDFTLCMFNLISQKNLQAIKKQPIHITEHQQLVLYPLKLRISWYLNSCATSCATRLAAAWQSALSLLQARPVMPCIIVPCLQHVYIVIWEWFKTIQNL